MANNSPYPLKDLEHVSASGLKDYSHCEVLGAYRRNFIGVSKVQQYPNTIYGTAFHGLAHKLGLLLLKKAKSNGGVIPPDYCKGFVKYARMFLMNVLNGKHGPRDEKDPPVVFRWFSYRRKGNMDAREYNQAIQEEKNKMYGRLYNAIESLRLDFTIPSGFEDMELEYNFSGLNVTLSAPLSDHPPIKLEGQIDRIRIFPAGEYDLTDYKTGNIINHYRSRHNLVEDIQMTVYDFVARMKYGKPPVALYIQPMDINTEHRKEHGPEAMRRLRNPVPVRNQDQFDDLGYFAADVVQMVRMVVNSESHSQAEREDWVPQSLYGRKAEIQKNVVEGRFVPRIGPWCETCTYSTLCQADHQSDWKEYRKQGIDFTEIAPDELPPIEAEEVEEEPADTLFFGLTPKRSRYIRKSDKVIKLELLGSKQFMPPKSSKGQQGFFSFINKILDWMRDEGPCQCLRLNLIPLWLVQFLPMIYRGEASLKACLAQCPYPDCQRKCQKEQTP